MKTVEERFWSKVERRGDDDCWPWMAYCNADCYGQFFIAGQHILAHRASWELTNRACILPGYKALHQCDNPPCRNPNHLFLGTYADNNADMIAKGRSALGSRNGQAKLNEWQVVSVMSRHLQGTSQCQIAHDLGVNFRTIHNIVSGKRWSHLFAMEGQ